MAIFQGLFYSVNLLLANSYSTPYFYLQWEHLLSLMKLLKPSLRKEVGLADLQRASAKFQEIAVSIRDDPRLMSLVEKRRGQKGLRELQGEVLRGACDSILTILVSVVVRCCYSGLSNLGIY